MSETTRQHKSEATKKINFAVIVASSSRFQKLKAKEPFNDPSGDIIIELIQSAGHGVTSRDILPDDRVLIGKFVGNSIGSEEVDVIIVCGGTGVSLKDVTIETVRPMLIKTLPGFGELFRKLSYDEIGSAAIMTRALAGTTDQGKAVFCIPGSPQAVNLAMKKLILPETGHILKHARE